MIASIPFDKPSIGRAIPVTPGISIIIPVAERRATAIADLCSEYVAVLTDDGADFEILVVGEPWSRDLLDEVHLLAARDSLPIRVFEAGHAVGESALLRAAIDSVRHNVIVTLPPYPRVIPRGLADLLERVRAGAPMATAKRSKRRDHWLNRIQSRVFHFILNRTTGTSFEDVASGVRAARIDVLHNVPLYGDAHRFLPLLVVNEGYAVQEVEVGQHPDDETPRIHPLGTYLRRAVDLVGIAFLIRFTQKPLRFFGQVGCVVSALGVVILAIITVQRVMGQPMANRPLLVLGVLLLVLGVQAVGLGLVGEIIVHFRASEGRGYRLAEEPTAATGYGPPSRSSSRAIRTTRTILN